MIYKNQSVDARATPWAFGTLTGALGNQIARLLLMKWSLFSYTQRSTQSEP